jgi:segregation and condensation protein B
MSERLEETMEPKELRSALEAILFVSNEPVKVEELAETFEVAPEAVASQMEEIRRLLDEQMGGFMLEQTAGGWRLATRAEHDAALKKYFAKKGESRMSIAALETLAIVAYKQPISRGQLAAIRGVSVDGVVRTLLQRGYIEESGRDPGPGQAVLYGTTRLFLEDLGLDGLADLPPLGAFVPGPEVMDVLEASLRPSDDDDEPDAEGPADADAPDADADADIPDTPDTPDTPDGSDA